jgi:glycosyltransferase involved in cell wall biosynthesis
MKPISNADTAHVVILQQSLPHYRLPFYQKLQPQLADAGVKLTLVYGTTEVPGAKDYPWAVHRPDQTISLLGNKALWQPVLPYLRGANLVIVQQASKLLLNYYLLARQQFGIGKLAFWGHGKNFQATKDNALAEWVKKRVSTRVHWWFAYNDLSQTIVEELGFPKERITNVQNAVDTSQLKHYAAQLTEPDRARVRERYKLTGNNIGLYCGRMYSEKRLGFLLETAECVRERVPDFELVLIGSGSDADLAGKAAARNPWVHYVGSKLEKEKAELFSVSKLFLMPGAIGLAILDAFALGIPMVTTNDRNHGPEIDYLHPGVNGLMTENNLGAYVGAVTELLTKPDEVARLQKNALQTSEYYTIERMAQNFHDGILSALAAP